MSDVSQQRKSSVRIKKAPVRLISEHGDYNRQHKNLQYKKLVQERRMKIKQKLKSKLSKAVHSPSPYEDRLGNPGPYKAEIEDQSELQGSRIISPFLHAGRTAVPKTVEDFLNVLIGKSSQNDDTR